SFSLNATIAVNGLINQGYLFIPRQIVKNESFVAFRLCRSARCVHDSRYCRRFS
ncbi:Hypothetical predicted protein, partial [Paramuricea clavata]